MSVASFLRSPGCPPLVLGHRGARREAPENTLPAFELATAQGAAGVELDVRLDGSGRVIVLHDRTLLRVTAGRDDRDVESLSADQLDQVTLDGGARVPTLEQVLGWAREEGWGPGLEDAGAFHAADPGGFLIGWLGTLPIGSISLVRYGEEQAFLGLFIVRPAFRGRGFGKALWQAAMDRAGARTIGLDAVPAQVGRYAAAGFVRAHGTTRWGGHLRGLVTTRSLVRPLGPEDAAAVAQYDAQAFGAPRPVAGNAGTQHHRLGIGGQVQVVLRAVAHQRTQVLAERVRRLGQRIAHRRMVAPGIEHAHRLRALARKDECKSCHARGSPWFF